MIPTYVVAMTPLQDFRDRVETFLALTGMAPSRFGDLACNDRAFVKDMRQGRREFRFSTIAKVDRFMSEYSSLCERKANDLRQAG